MLGKLLQGRYQIVQVLGSGGFCETYLAQDICQAGHPTYVIKHLKPVSNYSDSLQTLRQVFHREAQALKKLGNYDQVPELVDHFEDNQEFYLVQAFIVGHPLSAELQPDHRWTESQVVQLLQEVLDILEFVHSQGLIHRDIKPSNLIRRQQDNRLVLIDFGSSVKQAWTQVVTAQRQTNDTIALGIPATIAIGTPGYMPTEQGRGRPRLNSDIYALGMIGIQALTGLSPTQLLEDADTGEILWQSQAEVSAGLACVLNKMVRYHFKDRYQSAQEVLQALQLPVKTKEAKNVSPQATGSSTSPSPNKSVLLIAIGIGVASVALIFGFYYTLRSPAPAPKVQKYQSGLTKNTSFNISLDKTLTGHSDAVWSVAISPVGQQIVSSSGDKTIKIWNSSTGELLRTLSAHLGTVWSVASSLDGQTLASGSSDNTIKIWNLRTGELLHTLSGHSGTVWSVAYPIMPMANSPDGQTLASGSSDNTIKIWNLRTGKLLRTLSGHSDAVRSVALSSDGQTLVSGSSDNTIKIWNLRTGKLLRTLSGHMDRVISVALSPDGQIVASGSVDKTIKIWNLSSGKLLHTFSGHSDWVNSVAISPTGRTLASGIGKIIKIWDLNTLKLLYTMTSYSKDITSISFSADGKILVSGSGDKKINIWRL